MYGLGWSLVKWILGGPKRAPGPLTCQMSWNGKPCGGRDYKTYLLNEKFVKSIRKKGLINGLLKRRVLVTTARVCPECYKMSRFLRMISEFPLEPDQ